MVLTARKAPSLVPILLTAVLEQWRKTRPFSEAFVPLVVKPSKNRALKAAGLGRKPLPLPGPASKAVRGYADEPGYRQELAVSTRPYQMLLPQGQRLHGCSNA